jgi:hypothetical protein
LFFLTLRLISLQEKQKGVTQYRFLDLLTDRFSCRIKQKCPDIRVFPEGKGADIGTFKMVVQRSPCGRCLLGETAGYWEI